MITTTGGAVTAKAIIHSSLFKIVFYARRLPAMITRQGASSSAGARRRDHSSASSSAAACSIGNMIRTPRVREQPGSGAGQATNGVAPSGGECGAADSQTAPDTEPLARTRDHRHGTRCPALVDRQPVPGARDTVPVIGQTAGALFDMSTE